MSISKVGFHYLTEDSSKTVETLKNVEKAAIRNHSKPSTRLFLENDYPKGLILQYEHLVSAFPYVPDFGSPQYLCWLTFNTKKNSYAQEHGSLVVIADESYNISYRIEFWKDARKICDIQLDNESPPSYIEMSKFGKQVLLMAFPNKTYIDPPNIFQSAEASLEYYESLFGIPLISPSNTNGLYSAVGETKFMKIMRPITIQPHK